MEQQISGLFFMPLSCSSSCNKESKYVYLTAGSANSYCNFLPAVLAFPCEWTRFCNLNISPPHLLDTVWRHAEPTLSPTHHYINHQVLKATPVSYVSSRPQLSTLTPRHHLDHPCPGLGWPVPYILTWVVTFASPTELTMLFVNNETFSRFHELVLLVLQHLK